ncbi:hypothetical protein C3941_19500 [Kaistia algarum]|uniref:hypothetical protein n=1 Tax=Kaistia algarum TaxID=2083279 RepID=UPI000CE7464B|nr:hypothetical protein [Kaistia algarum]MCX5516178.1 hypothetical protein [Kaistia algarum]PPE78252.1 hypothetical protein C3941_19500 [Kaistia algarum]
MTDSSRIADLETEVKMLSGMLNAATEKAAKSINSRWAAEARVTALEARVKELEVDTSLLNWLEANPTVEIGLNRFDEKSAWEAHLVSGGVNDREWELLCTANTIRGAIKGARALLQPKDKSHD